MPFDLSKYTKQLGTGFEKLGPMLGKLGGGKEKTGDKIIAGVVAPEVDREIDTSSSLTKILMGSTSIVGEYYFPNELIGGTCPRVVGEEESIVWNAAAEACDSERIHVVWQSTEHKIWYLAVRSSELASHPNTWCPFACMLPGMKDGATPPVCYTYYGDESATMMMITNDGLQIYRGTSLVVRAKAERSARELGDAPVIELVPDKILELTPVPWYSLSLFEDQARRVLSALAVFGALSLAALAFIIWLLASMSLIATRHSLTDTLARSQDKSMELMRTVEQLRSSPMRDQLAKFADLNDGLLAINGYLQVYEIKNNKVRWRAVIPANVTADRITDLGGKNIEPTPQGLAIGNQAEVEFEAAGGKH